MKDPAFLFYPNDWMGGTQWLTFEQKGCYIDLLILQFNTGKFTESQAKQVLSICFDLAWPVLKQKFIFDGEFYYNERLKIEIERRRLFTESRKINGLQPKKTKKAYAKHMGNRNRNENIIDFIPENYIEIVSKWLDFKKEKKQSYKGEKSILAMFNHLVKLSGDSPDMAMAIVEQSIANNYSGLFELKKNGTNRQNNSGAGNAKRVIAEAAADLARRLG